MIEKTFYKSVQSILDCIIYRSNSIYAVFVMFHFFENLVDPFDNRSFADPPPKSVWVFLVENWRSFNTILVALFFATLITATLEVLFLVGIGKFMDYVGSQTDIFLDNL